MSPSAVLRAIFDTLNDKVFSHALTVSSFGLDISRSLVCRWSPDLNSMVLGLAAASSTLYEIKIAVVHEMLHLLNAQNRLQDESVNQYHNKHFAISATRAGLCCVRHRKNGWSLLSLTPPCNVVDRSAIKLPSPAANETIAAAFSEVPVTRQDWNIACRAIRRSLQQAVPARVFQHKYICECPPPHNSVRCGRRPNGQHAPDITCNRCGAKFTCEV